MEVSNATKSTAMIQWHFIAEDGQPPCAGQYLASVTKPLTSNLRGLVAELDWSGSSWLEHDYDNTSAVGDVYAWTYMPQAPTANYSPPQIYSTCNQHCTDKRQLMECNKNLDLFLEQTGMAIPKIGDVICEKGGLPGIVMYCDSGRYSDRYFYPINADLYACPDTYFDGIRSAIISAAAAIMLKKIPEPTACFEMAEDGTVLVDRMFDLQIATKSAIYTALKIVFGSQWNTEGWLPWSHEIDVWSTDTSPGGQKTRDVVIRVKLTIPQDVEKVA